ncbi:MAG TPA: NADPH-dependent FMN reductase [Parafilimonas sp.]|nr:NADPH-dependent FMN reductase [Parafilimonas sp.]
MNSEIHLAGISGSLRRGSYNTALLNALYPLLPEDVSMEIVSIAGIPLYDADLDMPEAEKRPSIVQHFRDCLSKVDGIVIVSPEYNYSIPGGLKNAIDWASRGTDSPLLNKPVALMGATPGMWGTVRMQTAFLPVFVFLNMKPVLKPEVLIAQAATKFDAKGNLTDEKAKEIIRQKLTALKGMILLEHETHKVF